MIDQIIEYNKTFVAQKGYEKYITDKYPDKKLAVLPKDIVVRGFIIDSETGALEEIGRP
jgi:carbonic anhydrase